LVADVVILLSVGVGVHVLVVRHLRHFRKLLRLLRRLLLRLLLCEHGRLRAIARRTHCGLRCERRAHVRLADPGVGVGLDLAQLRALGRASRRTVWNHDAWHGRTRVGIERRGDVQDARDLLAGPHRVPGGHRHRDRPGHRRSRHPAVCQLLRARWRHHLHPRALRCGQRVELTQLCGVLLHARRRGSGGLVQACVLEPRPQRLPVAPVRRAPTCVRPRTRRQHIVHRLAGAARARRASTRAWRASTRAWRACGVTDLAVRKVDAGGAVGVDARRQPKTLGLGALGLPPARCQHAPRGQQRDAAAVRAGSRQRN